MSKKRIHLSDREKAKIALSAVQNEGTLSELGRRFKVHPVQISKWRSQLIAESYQLFGRKSNSHQSRSYEELEEELQSVYEKLGRVTVENDFLKKKALI
jgi:transposase